MRAKWCPVLYSICLQNLAIIFFFLCYFQYICIFSIFSIYSFSTVKIEICAYLLSICTISSSQPSWSLCHKEKTVNKVQTSTSEPFNYTHPQNDLPFFHLLQNLPVKHKAKTVTGDQPHLPYQPWLMKELIFYLFTFQPWNTLKEKEMWLYKITYNENSTDWW